jgi:glycosyltransferase involved in cell wall biosynthesis
MRIALVYLGRRGAGGLISQELGLRLSEQVDLLVVLSIYNDQLESWKTASIDSILVPTYRNLVGGIWTWLVHQRIRKVANQIRAWKPDVLFFPSFYTWNPFIQHYLPEIPGVIMVHDPVPHPGFRGLFYRILEDYSIRKAKRYLILSQMFSPSLVQRGAEKDSIDVVPLGMLNYANQVDSGSVEVMREQFPPVLLFFGRITAYKGLDVLLRAFLNLRQEREIKLLIVGSGSLAPYAYLLRDMKGIEIVNRWIGEDEIPGFFKQASIVILPYTSASQSGVITIAASFAKPVVAAEVGGIVEQIDHGRTGLLVPPASVIDLESAIRLLLDGPERARDMGENLRMDFLEKKNWLDTTSVVLIACAKAIE